MSDEPRAPYERPPLSKGLHTAPVWLRPLAQYSEAGVELRLGTAAEVDAEARVVRLGGGESLPFDVALLAVGVAPRRLSEVPDAMYLRRLEDAEALSAAVAGGRLAILGAGFIGCEVAASARARGCEVVLQEALKAPLLRVLGPRLGAWLAEVHRAHGVDLQLGASELPVARPLLVAIGTEPRGERHLRVDELGRTEIEGVYAAGDCAEWFSPIYRRHVRVEHFQTAWRHGAAVGRAMAGAGEPFGEAPWFWSDQYDLNLQYAGAGVPWDEELVRGSFGAPPFTVFQLSGGEVVGALGVGDARTISRVRRLLEAQVSPARAELEDPAFDLRTPLGRLR